LGAGPVSFTHIVKALEPVFSALVSGIVLKEWLSPTVYLTLIPVIGGVGYACLKERSFSQTALIWAMASNLAFAVRAVSSKLAMTSNTKSKSNTKSNNPMGTNVTSTNLFAMVTMASFVLSVPICLIWEGYDSFVAMWKTATLSVPPSELLYRVALSGLFHYGNNEVMYQALSKVHPVTLAVGNTMKRVFIMVASVMVFRNPVSMQAGIGSAVGIGGVLLYSIVKAQSERTPPKGDSR
jgi:solute carrier family 35, member E1